MPERMTLDLDILILAQDAASIYNRLKQAGGRQISELSIPGSQWELADGTFLDVLILDVFSRSPRRYGKPGNARPTRIRSVVKG